MVKLTVVSKTDVPEGACTTVGAVMPRIFCVITGEKANVYQGKKCIRKFQHSENGILKRDKVHKKIRLSARVLLQEVSKRGPLLISRRPAVEKSS